MKQKKTHLTSFRVALLIIFLISCIPYAAFNLEIHAIYYAMHTPHKEGMYPEIIELTDHMDSMFQPLISEDDSISVHLERMSTNILLISALDRERQMSFTLYGGRIGQEGEYEFSKYNEDEPCLDDEESYCFNSNCKVRRLSITKDDILYEEPTSPIDSTKLNEEILQVFDPVFQQQISPLINLQWLYDVLNHDRFC